jgi:hypothetical protein
VSNVKFGVVIIPNVLDPVGMSFFGGETNGDVRVGVDLRKLT